MSAKRIGWILGFILAIAGSVVVYSANLPFWMFFFLAFAMGATFPTLGEMIGEDYDDSHGG